MDFKKTNSLLQNFVKEYNGYLKRKEMIEKMGIGDALVKDVLDSESVEEVKGKIANREKE